MKNVSIKGSVLAAILLLGSTACEKTTDPPAPPSERVLVVVDVVGGSSPGVVIGDLTVGGWIPLLGPLGTPRHPTVAKRRVVFVQTQDGRRALRTILLVGGLTDDVPISGVVGDLAEPALSHDGELVAFTATPPDGVPQLWVAPGAGGQAVRVTASSPDVAEGSPTWSPSGTHLAFVSTESGSPQVYVRDLPGGETVQLTTGGAHTDPAWHPTRPLLVYAAERGGQTDLYLLDLDTGVETRLTERAEDDIRPAWLTEDEIAYVARVGSALTLRRLELDAPGSSVLIELPGGGEPGHPTGVR